MELLLDKYPGFTETIQPDDKGMTIITTQHNHARILAENAEMRKNHRQAPQGDQTWGNMVGRIPMNDFAELQREWKLKGEGGEKEFMVWLVQKLNQNPKWKVFDGNA